MADPDAGVELVVLSHLEDFAAAATAFATDNVWAGTTTEAILLRRAGGQDLTDTLHGDPEAVGQLLRRSALPGEVKDPIVPLRLGHRFTSPSSATFNHCQCVGWYSVASGPHRPVVRSSSIVGRQE